MALNGKSQMKITMIRPIIICAILSSTTMVAADRKPNIIVIFTDDHGYADLSCQGVFDDVRTPYMDSLARGGVRMTSGYATAPQCGPSRAGLISGQYQNKFGLDANGAGREATQRFWDLDLLPERLKKAGYVTGMAGKSHLGSNDSGELTQLGFDKVYFKHSNAPGHWNMNLEGKDMAPQVQKGGGYHLELISQFACTFITRFADKPFFFYLAYRAPHVPLDATEKYLERFPGKMPERRRKALAMLSAVDDGVGNILATLRRHGIEENTLIFIIGDNGAPLKIHKLDAPGGGPGWDGSLNDPMNGEKGTLIEGGIRTPFVVYWKDTIPGGQVYNHPVIALDVAATANSLAGLAEDSDLDGVNLIPYLTHQKHGAPHEVLFWSWGGQFAIRKGKWKYLTGGGRNYLFDLDTDVSETTNLLAKYPEKGAALRTALEAWSQTLYKPGIPDKLPVAGSKYFDWYLDGIRNIPVPSISTDEAPQKRKRNRR